MGNVHLNTAKQKRKRSPSKPAIVPTSPRDQEDAEIDTNNTVESILEKLSPPQIQATSPIGARAPSTAHLVVPDELNLSGILNVLDGTKMQERQKPPEAEEKIVSYCRAQGSPVTSYRTLFEWE